MVPFDICLAFPEPPGKPRASIPEEEVGSLQWVKDIFHVQLVGWSLGHWLEDGEHVGGDPGKLQPLAGGLGKAQHVAGVVELR